LQQICFFQKWDFESMNCIKHEWKDRVSRCLLAPLPNNKSDYIHYELFL
jgi:hypothetical protein